MTITLAGKITDISNRPLDQLTRATVKFPTYTLGEEGALATSAPHAVEVEEDGTFTLDVVPGKGWLFLEGPGWSESVGFIASSGMSNFIEAVSNFDARPIYDLIRELIDVMGASTEADLEELVGEAKMWADIANRAEAVGVTWFKGNLPSNTDLNTLTDKGVWRTRLSTDTASLANRPADSTTSPCIVEVVPGSSVNEIFVQRFLQYSNGVLSRWERASLVGTWSAWDKIMTSKQMPGGNLVANQDLNTVTTPGRWTAESSTIAASLVNRPEGTRTGPLTLEVLQVSDMNNVIYQTLKQTNMPDKTVLTWEREIFGDAISPWVQTGGELPEVPNTLDPTRVVAVGDSHSDGAATSWTNSFADVSGLTLVNHARSGATADEALLRAGGRSMWIQGPVTLTAGTRVPVTVDWDAKAAMHQDRATAGEIDGRSVSMVHVPGTDSWYAVLSSGDDMVIGSGEKKQWWSNLADNEPTARRIVWMGGNGVRSNLHRPDETLTENVQKAYSWAVATWGPSTIVCGYIPAYGDTRGRDVADGLSVWLQQKLPNNFLDIRCAVQLAAPKILGRSLTAQEQQDIAEGYLPAAMYTDTIHFTAETHAEIARIFARYPLGATPELGILRDSTATRRYTLRTSPTIDLKPLIEPGWTCTDMKIIRIGNVATLHVNGLVRAAGTDDNSVVLHSSRFPADWRPLTRVIAAGGQLNTTGDPAFLLVSTGIIGYSLAEGWANSFTATWGLP